MVIHPPEDDPDSSQVNSLSSLNVRFMRFYREMLLLAM